jgi:hypothetical protein
VKNVVRPIFAPLFALGGVVFGYGGSGYFGDDPKDAYWIRIGIRTYQATKASRE